MNYGKNLNQVCIKHSRQDVPNLHQNCKKPVSKILTKDFKNLVSNLYQSIYM
jgi:hypothetical protein